TRRRSTATILRRYRRGNNRLKAPADRSDRSIGSFAVFECGAVWRSAMVAEKSVAEKSICRYVSASQSSDRHSVKDAAHHVAANFGSVHFVGRRGAGLGVGRR